MSKHPKTLALLLILTVLAFGLVAYANIAQAKDVTVTFSWDTDTSGGWEKLNFYERDEAAGYNYNQPIFTLPQTYDADGNSQPVTTPITTTYPDGQKATKFWVVRAQAGDLESADSEEVSWTVDLTPLEPFTFTAVYNDVAKTIDMAWQITDARITRWEIYTADAAGGPYTKLTAVNNTEGMETTYSVPEASLFPDGEKTTKYFTMVAFAPYDIFSANAAEIAITVNKRPPSGVVNFKIILTQ